MPHVLLLGAPLQCVSLVPQDVLLPSASLHTLAPTMFFYVVHGCVCVLLQAEVGKASVGVTAGDLERDNARYRKARADDSNGSHSGDGNNSDDGLYD